MPNTMLLPACPTCNAHFAQLQKDKEMLTGHVALTKVVAANDGSSYINSISHAAGLFWSVSCPAGKRVSGTGPCARSTLVFMQMLLLLVHKLTHNS
jgi:hypothetical protein